MQTIQCIGKNRTIISKQRTRPRKLMPLWLDRLISQVRLLE